MIRYWLMDMTHPDYQTLIDTSRALVETPTHEISITENVAKTQSMVKGFDVTQEFIDTVEAQAVADGVVIAAYSDNAAFLKLIYTPEWREPHEIT